MVESLADLYKFGSGREAGLAELGTNQIGLPQGNGVWQGMKNFGGKTGDFLTSDKFANGMQGITSLAGALSAYKQLGLMEDQFDLNKGLANRNLSNQAATLNPQLLDRAKMQAQMYGNAPGSTGYSLAESSAPRVDGSAI